MLDKERVKQQGIWISEFLIRATKDEMLLYVEVDPEDKGAIEVLKEKWEEVKKELKEKGFYGVLEEPEIIQEKVVVAKGKLPRTPLPERVELYEKFLPLLKKNVIEEEKEPEGEKDKVDLREGSQKIICAEKDEGIGRWYPEIPGEDGKNVFGEEIKAPRLKEERKIEFGEGIYIDDDNVIRAKESGVVQIKADKLEVYPEYEIRGDVDFSVGNVNFIGKKLVIEGDIKFGFRVVVKGELELKGGTENKVYIEVDGGFKCEGIIRGEDTLVKVKGKAEVKGVEFASLEVDGELVVNSYLIFCDAKVKGFVKVVEGKGMIYGGCVKSSEDIEVKILGNESHTPTKVFAGYQPEIIEGYLKFVHERLLIDETLKKLKKGLELGKRLKKEGKLTKEKEKILEKIEEQLKIYDFRLEEIEENLKELRKKVAILKTKAIKVLERVYPGVSVGITDVVYVIPEEKQGPLKFYLEASIIQTASVKD